MEKIVRFIVLVLLTLQISLAPASAVQAVPNIPAANEFTVRFHPDGPLYAGDQVSIEVISPKNASLKDAALQVSALLDDEAKNIGSANFDGFSGGRYHAVLLWAWDTRGLPPGSYQLQFTIPQRSIRWQETVRLNEMPAKYVNARWEVAETECCRLHYISGTDAEADLAQLVPMLDAQAKDVTQKMGVKLKDKMDINLIPRVLGQGGFTTDEVYVSYKHGSYANGNSAVLIHHELVHRVDLQITSDFRPTFLMEGLAVYLTGGHYQPEPVMLRAAGLLSSGHYISLPYLINNFYPSQHETGYIEAGAFIEYMVQSWGWGAYNAFYRDIHQPPNGDQAKAIDAALKEHYGISLQEIEDRFINYLTALPVIPDIHDNLETTLRLYDDIREYQKVLDPSAYFEQAWLPDAKKMREKGITGDYLRGPEQPANLQMEDLLFQAGKALNSGNFIQANQILGEVEKVLSKAQVPGIKTITASLVQPVGH
jgi:hypothetical protein